MRKIVSIAAVAALCLGIASCDNGKLKERNAQLEGDVEGLVATQDTLLGLVNELTEGMNQIKQLENIISTPGALGESSSKKEQIRNDMLAIQQALEARRQRLDELEKQLANDKGQNAKLLKTISSLKEQIANQEREISTMKEQLAAANVQIAELNTTVDSLSTGLETEKREREIAQEASTAMAEQLNTCYYAIGTKNELKANKILESGFLRKTKIMESDFNMSYFTKADKRTLTSIPLNAKKGEVMTKQPKDSYNISEVNGAAVLNITNPEKFWSMSNYLVIKVD
ncbi:MAG: hypothetical protein NC187_01585 [Candidatus Amulumruptor caecigallinarius]|nr:hypothetical protein [Candidatus Amulumruptor caecigallinarius]MCM1396167.1 hypothetical protein [Candidatus Amulumruptor caecigallinarius]MCM1453833.1 hypothetical protein [bacterium]